VGQQLPIFMEAVPEYRIRSGRMHIIWPELEIVLPVHTMLAGMAGAKQEIDDWQRNGSAHVLEFRREFP
jgi:hypothetical protein